MQEQLLCKEVLSLIKFLMDKIMTKIKITQTRSKIGFDKRQQATLQALGLNKTNDSVEKEVNAQIQGMVNKVKHLVKVENI